ncbi:MAG: hypothetical protein ING36_06505, partial [Burkholderiales bacterium]|nr:hypothetical protein [Burkholderiales bacterium]
MRQWHVLWRTALPASPFEARLGHWQRGERPNAGGLGHDERSAKPEGNAPGNEASGTWVRVAQTLAGPNW